MRTSLVTASLLGLMLACTPGRAGVYLADDPRPWPVLNNTAWFQGVLFDLQTVAALDRGESLIARQLGILASPLGVLPGSQFATDIAEELLPRRIHSLTGRVRTEVARLEAQRGNLSFDELLNLGSYYALMGSPSRAERAFAQALTRNPNHFQALAGIASAYLVQEDFPAALRFQESALAAWPRSHAGWSSERLRWHYRVEKLTLELIQKRSREKKPSSGGWSRVAVKLDDLFPGVEFVGPSGKYQPGEIHPRMRDKLPPDALALVQQLLLSHPTDFRLEWLWAELANAQGDLERAYRSINKLVELGFPGEGMRVHRATLEAALEVEKAFPPDERRKLLFSLAMPGGLFAHEAGRAAHLLAPGNQAWRWENGSEDKPKEKEKTDGASDTPSWLPDLKVLGIGLGVGTLFGALLVLQWRQIFRRRA
jgi:tetratricopeptide (TPR) repeat protein